MYIHTNVLLVYNVHSFFCFVNENVIYACNQYVFMNVYKLLHIFYEHVSIIPVYNLHIHIIIYLYIHIMKIYFLYIICIIIHFDILYNSSLSFGRTSAGIVCCFWGMLSTIHGSRKSKCVSTFLSQNTMHLK